MTVKAAQGACAFHSGVAAEMIVARWYEARGYQIAGARFRASGGEIDLIARGGSDVVFIEVKKSKTHAQAAASLSSRQVSRIYQAASVFLASEPKGQDTNARFDVALVDGQGHLDIVENAFVD